MASEPVIKMGLGEGEAVDATDLTNEMFDNTDPWIQRKIQDVLKK